MGKELSAVIGVHGVARGTRVCRAIKRKAEFQSRRSAGTSKSERLVEHSICPSAVYSRSIVACRTTSKRRRQRAAVDDCMADVVTEARRHQHGTAGTAAFVVGLCCAGVVFLFLWVPLIWAMFGRLALRSVRCGWSAIFAAIARAFQPSVDGAPLA
jgi:hypothetical protein